MSFAFLSQHTVYMFPWKQPLLQVNLMRECILHHNGHLNRNMALLPGWVHRDPCTVLGLEDFMQMEGVSPLDLDKTMAKVWCKPHEWPWLLAAHCRSVPLSYAAGFVMRGLRNDGEQLWRRRAGRSSSGSTAQGVRKNPMPFSSSCAQSPRDSPSAAVLNILLHIIHLVYETLSPRWTCRHGLNSNFSLMWDNGVV